MSCSKCVPSFCISSLTRKPTALRHLSKSACGHCFLSRSPWIKPTFYTRTNSRRSPDCLNDVQYCGVCILPREFQRRRSYTLASSAHTFGVRDNASENCVQGLTSSGTSNERDISVLAGTPKGLERLKEAFCDESTRGALTPELQNRLVTACFTFALDRFQREALDALIESRNVILSAPTGSGKTVVGEMAILLALARNLRVFYTTPLKALSNQKFLDFKKLFGDSRVGLLTGDIAVNRDAEIVVMTTEVYRNMLYANGSGTDGSMIPVTDDVFAVVFGTSMQKTEKFCDEAILCVIKIYIYVSLCLLFENISGEFTHFVVDFTGLLFLSVCCLFVLFLAAPHRLCRKFVVDLRSSLLNR